MKVNLLMMDVRKLRLVDADDGDFDASANLQEIDARVKWFDHYRWRDLHCLDLFGGHGNFGSLCMDACKRVMSIDKIADPIMQNILTKPGFYAILSLVCSLEAQ